MSDSPIPYVSGWVDAVAARLRIVIATCSAFRRIRPDDLEPAA